MARLTLSEWQSGDWGLVFDTCVLIDAWHSAMKGSALWVDLSRRCAPERRHMTVVNVHELLAGQTDKLEARLRQREWARERFKVVGFSRGADSTFRTYLESLPAPPPDSLGDWLIAAMAQSRKLALATSNLEDFAVFEKPGLALVHVTGPHGSMP